MKDHQANANHLLHKNRLQEYTQKSALPLPIYRTVNEGFPHAPKFRSTVLVDGKQYVSTLNFAHRKAAEQEVARLALECIAEQTRDERFTPINQNPRFCKSIMHEYAVKKNMDIPTYTTTSPEGPHPVFVSQLVFDGKTYAGDVAGSKKMAEQLAARAAIQSLLGSDSGTLKDIIQSKVRFYPSLNTEKDAGLSQGISPVAVLPESASINPEKDAGLSQEILPTAVQPENSPGQLTSVPSLVASHNSFGTSLDPSSGGKRRLEITNCELKKIRTDEN